MRSLRWFYVRLKEEGLIEISYGEFVEYVRELEKVVGEVEDGE